MRFSWFALGLVGFLVGGMVGAGARLLGAPVPGFRTRRAFLSETHSGWRRAFPEPHGKRNYATTATRGMKKEINWKAGRLEWVRQEVRDEQRS